MRKLMIGFLIIFVLTALGVAGFYAFDQQSSPKTVSMVRGLPQVEWKDIHGQTFTFEDFRGRWVLLHFWATWCESCLNEVPEIIEFTQREKGVLLMVSSDETFQEMETFFKKIQYPLKDKKTDIYFIWDEGQKITQKVFHTLRLPETIVIGPDLKMIQKIIGDGHWKDKTQDFFKEEK